MTPQRLEPALRAALPELRELGRWTRLGGSINYVWRVEAPPRTVIAKHAPPHVATAPELPLSQRRSAFEAAALCLLGPGGELADCLGAAVRAPRLLGAAPEHALLVLEDAGPCPDLATALRERPELAPRLGELGAAIGRLHARSAGRAELAARFDNADVQRARGRLQYAAVGAMLQRAGVADAAALGARARALGHELLEPGRALVMGDLWPQSVLVPPGDAPLVLIDWEFAHYGRPLQDVAHLAAHLWMRAECAPDARSESALRGALEAFLRGYARAVAARPGLFGEAELAGAGVHLACEILMRALGPFQTSGPYERLAPDSAPIRAAIDTAAQLLREPQQAEPLAPLREALAAAHGEGVSAR